MKVGQLVLVLVLQFLQFLVQLIVLFLLLLQLIGQLVELLFASEAARIEGIGVQIRTGGDRALTDDRILIGVQRVRFEWVSSLGWTSRGFAAVDLTDYVRTITLLVSTHVRAGAGHAGALVLRRVLAVLRMENIF